MIHRWENIKVHMGEGYMYAIHMGEDCGVYGRRLWYIWEKCVVSVMAALYVYIVDMYFCMK